MEVVMHDALTGVALLIGLVAGVAVTLRLTADPRTGAIASLVEAAAARCVTDYHEEACSSNTRSLGLKMSPGCG
jgi:hypothetical protein